MKKIIVMTCALAALSMHSIAFANQKPRGLETDSRIKIVAYNPNDVVTIRGSHRIATGIEFDPDESVITINNGDSIAWTTAYNKATPNMVYVKPVLPITDTNMTIITNKRQYLFHLISSENDNPSSRNVTYLVEFKYPDEEKAALEGQIIDLQRTFLGGNASGDPVQWNYNYSFYGSPNIAPIQAVDNGKFTIFKFGKNVQIPAIFSVDRHQNESIVNFRVQGKYVFVQGVYHQFTLRNGQDVTAVYNDAYQVN